MGLNNDNNIINPNAGSKFQKFFIYLDERRYKRLDVGSYTVDEIIEKVTKILEHENGEIIVHGTWEVPNIIRIFKEIWTSSGQLGKSYRRVLVYDELILSYLSVDNYKEFIETTILCDRNYMSNKQIGKITFR